MAKHPTPKRRLPKSDGRKRYSSFQMKARRRLQNQVQLRPCPQCGEMKQNHHLCGNCGHYRGRQVIDMSKKIKDAVKTISA